MSPETKNYIKKQCKDIMLTCDVIKSADSDQFTIMRIALIYSLAEAVFKHLEV